MIVILCITKETTILLEDVFDQYGAGIAFLFPVSTASSLQVSDYYVIIKSKDQRRNIMWYIRIR